MPKKHTKPEPIAGKAIYDKGFAAMLREGARTPFWLGLKQIIEENIAYLDRIIIGEGLTLDEDAEWSEHFEITKRDLLRKWRNLNRELLDLPEKVAQSAEMTTIQLPTQLQPYESVHDEIKK